MQLGVNLYLRITEVTLGVSLIMYQLGKELEMQELATINEMRIISTTYTCMMIPLIVRLELIMFEREDIHLYISIPVIICGVCSYVAAGYFTIYIFYSHSEEDWASYNTEEKHFKMHAYIKAFIALLQTITLIADLVLTILRKSPKEEEMLEE